jgi:hypothetical protein
MNKFICLILISFIVSSCKFDIGTDVGNPAKPQQDNGQMQPGEGCGKSRCMPTPIVMNHIVHICKKIVTQCLGLSLDSTFMSNCVAEIYLVPHLQNFISINVDNYKTLETLYRQKEISYDLQKFDSCHQKIENLTCESSEFNDAFNVNQPEDYSKVHNILYVDQSCQNIFYKK